MDSKKTILITGINGFLGSHIANKLNNLFNIIGLDYGLNDPLRNLNHKIKVYSSLKKNLNQIFQENQIYAIIHTATVYQKFNDSFEKLINTNILLPVQLLELSNKFSVKLFINTDTFFNQSQSKYSYLSYYTLSKKHFIDWRNEITGSCEFITLKLFHLYGPNDKLSKFIPTIIKTLLKNSTQIDLTEGEQLRDFIFVDDVVDAYLCILNNFILKQNLLPEYEVGSRKAISIKNLVLQIKEITNSSTLLNFNAIPYRDNEIMYSRANNNPLIDIGWKANYSLEDGLKKTIEFYKNQC